MQKQQQQQQQPKIPAAIQQQYVNFKKEYSQLFKIFLDLEEEKKEHM